jgi:hypothetical protein
VTVGEGAIATNLVTATDPEDGPIDLSSSLAGSTFTDNGNGTWTWSFTSSDGPVQSQEVTITATDDGGKIDTVTFDLVVNNLPPTADAGGPYTVIPGGTVTLDASGSTDPAGAADPLTYSWDFDGDLAFDDATGANPVFDPAAFGVAPGQTATVAVQVGDGDGGLATDTATVTVAGTGVFLIDGTLFTLATTGADSVSVQLVGGQLVVSGAFIPGGSASFNPGDVDLIVIEAGNGDDTVSIPNNVTIDVQINGGSGSDMLLSGGGDDLVLGGSGGDLILTCVCRVWKRRRHGRRRRGPALRRRRAGSAHRRAQQRLALGRRGR